MKGVAMNVLVAGATGALGRQLVPLLVAAGHEVVGMMRSASKRDALRTLGATPVVADALDPEQVARAVAGASADAIIHQLTALSGGLDMRRFDCTFAATNRLRTEGTDHLLAASRAVGVRRFLAQSFAGWPYARTGGPIKDEESPFDPHPPAALRTSLLVRPGPRASCCATAVFTGRAPRSTDRAASMSRPFAGACSR